MARDITEWLTKYPRDRVTFELKQIHLDLMKRTYVGWDGDAYDGAPAVDIKRPYGNSDVPGDIYEVLHGDEWQDNHGDDEMPEELVEELMAIHKEMDTAIQVVLAAQSFELGIYETVNIFRTEWRKAA